MGRRMQQPGHSPVPSTCWPSLQVGAAVVAEAGQVSCPVVCACASVLRITACIPWAWRMPACCLRMHSKAAQRHAQCLLLTLTHAGLRFQGVPVEQVGAAVALAAADNPGTLPLRAAERKTVEARQVGRVERPGCWFKRTRFVGA